MDQDELDDEQRAALLQDRLREMGHPAATVKGLTRLSAGASRRTYSFDLASDSEALEGMILTQQVPPNVDPGRLAIEVAALRAAGAHGVPVAPVVDSADQTGFLGVPYLITERITGESIPRRILRGSEYAAARGDLAHRLGEVLAGIHSIPTSAVPGLEIADPLAVLEELYESIDEPRPVVEIGLNWLRRHRPVDRQPNAVVHGDFRLGNLLVAPEGLQAVLDWEAVHGGDPYEDLGWLCVKAWRFGMTEPVAGIGTREELLAGYVAAGGTAPSPAVLHWWEVLGTLRWAVVCRLQARRFELGLESGIDFAVLGRKVCEQEFDVLAAIDFPGRLAPNENPAHSIRPVDDVQDWPTADVLIAAARRAYHDAAAETSGHTAYLGKVAANALGIVERELTLGPAHRDQHRRSLAALGCDSERQLALAIRNGSIGDENPLLGNHVWATVRNRLLVANPAFDRGEAPVPAPA